MTSNPFLNPLQTLSTMRSALATALQHRPNRSRSSSLSTVPPASTSSDYDPSLASIAASIIYKNPEPSSSGLPIYILNAAAFPDAYETDYDALLPYVLARLPGEDELLSGTEYEIIFFAGGQPDSATQQKKQGPGVGWYIQAYHVLSRATRKKLQRLYIVHPRGWVKVLIGVFGTIVSPKFRRKIVSVNTLSQLALQLPIERLLVPQAVYLCDRKFSQDVYAPYATGRWAFGALHPLPKNLVTGEKRLPRVLRETTTFLLKEENVRTEGLFRIPPHSILAGVLKEAYDRGQKYIVWKELDAVVVDPGMPEALLAEIRNEDTYGPHLAASLIKSWYRDLREPIFPETSYETLRERYGDPSAKITPEDLVDILLLESETSPLSPTSREILTRHLLPLLTEVANHEPQNKMSPENLAICFAMALLCGSNQMEDARMTPIIRRILEAGIEAWPLLREGMGISPDAFRADLQPPAEATDYEDPLDTGRQSINAKKTEQVEIDDTGHRIILADFEDLGVAGTRTSSNPVSASSQTSAPALPKRPRSSQGLLWSSAQTNGVIAGPYSPPVSAHTTPTKSAPASAVVEKGKPPPLPPRIPSNTPNPEPHLLHRKPAPTPSPRHSDPSSALPLVLPSLDTTNPPRYSTVFDTDGRSLLSTTNNPNAIADSPASYVADGMAFAPSLRHELERIGNTPPNEPTSAPAAMGSNGYPVDEKIALPDEKTSLTAQDAATNTASGNFANGLGRHSDEFDGVPDGTVNMPKRKAVSGDFVLKTWTEEAKAAEGLGPSALSRNTSHASSANGGGGGGGGNILGGGGRSRTVSGASGGGGGQGEAGPGYWAKFAAQRAVSGRMPASGPYSSPKAGPTPEIQGAREAGIEMNSSADGATETPQEITREPSSPAGVKTTAGDEG